MNMREGANQQSDRRTNQQIETQAEKKKIETHACILLSTELCLENIFRNSSLYINSVLTVDASVTSEVDDILVSEMIASMILHSVTNFRLKSNVDLVSLPSHHQDTRAKN